MIICGSGPALGGVLCAWKVALRAAWSRPRLAAGQEGRAVASIGVSSSQCRGNLVVTLRGELDITQAAELGRALAAAAICGPRIIVDLAELTFIDCAGLSVLVAAQRTARGAGADLVLAAVQQPVARLLCLTNRVGVLPVFASVAEAASGAPLTPAAVSLAPGRAGCKASSVNG